MLHSLFFVLFFYAHCTMPYSLHRKRCLIIGDIGGVTSASARCHSTVANSPSEVAACRCSTLYIPDKSMSAADCIGRDWGGVGGFKDSKKKRGEWVIVILSTHTISLPSQTQWFKLTHLTFSPPSLLRITSGEGEMWEQGDGGRIAIKEAADNTLLWYRG